MHSISAPSDDTPPGGPTAVSVWHYDGLSAVRRDCDLIVAGDTFRLSGGGAVDEAVRFADLEPRDAVGGDAIFGLKKRPGWRIGFAGGVPAAVAAHLPRHARYGRLIDRFGLLPSIVVFTLIAAGAVTLVLMAPAAIARAIPAKWERQMGDLMVGDLGGRTCNGGEGGAALKALVERIDSGDREIDVRVVNLPMVNAVTLPGGRIVIFDKLLREAKSADEVAGVLAHEIGHVKNRDVMESLLRQLGLSVLLGGLDGNVGGYTNALLASTYSRGAETRADNYAIAMLGDAAISPIATAQFFDRLDGRKAGDKKGANRNMARTMNYFASHPISADRADAFTASAKGRRDFRPALDAAQWRALQNVCATDRDVEKPEFRF